MQPEPRTYHHSLDWRFLLPLPDPAQMYLLLEADEEVSQALERVGVPRARLLSLADLRRVQSRTVPSLVLPFGPAAGWAASGADQAAFYASLREAIAPAGHLLVGFDNAWNRATRRAGYRSCPPGRLMDQLRQAGFSSVRLFGAMPDLRIPEYIFDLDPRTVHFALRSRFRRKPAVLRALRLLAATVGMARLSNLLPCYFALAAT